jgi:dipeptidyl aminopeptidase/acylaminoacyl peptidase
MRRKSAKIFAVAAVLAAGASLAVARETPGPPSGSFTLGQVLSYPYPLELKASRSGTRVAWIENRRGARNVWVAEGPAWKARRLTDNDGDDGLELTQLQLSDDGRHLVWVRGGSHDANWPSPGGVEPNPALAPQKPAIEIWSADFEKGSPRKLAEGDAPAISPNGERVAYLKDHQAWSIAFDGKKDAASLFFCRGETGSLAWSPDGRRLAFVSDRGDHSLIGIYSSEKDPIRFLAPSASLDSNPVWSPDGTRVAFIRQPGKGGPPEKLLEEEPAPWSIWTADAGTGQARAAWSSPETLAGSLPETDAGPSLQWASGGRLVFLAELDGWPHLYSVADSGGAPLLLTPGNFMVDAIALTPDRRQVVYVANTGADPDDDDRRHLFRVPVDAAQPAAITSGAGLEWMPAVTGDGSTVVFVAAGAKSPPRPAVVSLAGGAPRRLAESEIPPDFPTESLVVARKVVFRSADGLAIHGQVFETPGGAAKKPALLFIHGGPPRQMLLGWHYMDYYSCAYAMNQYLASRGYVAMTVNYRLGVGYGRAFQHPQHAGPAGAAEYQDVLAAGKYLASLPEVDGSRVGVWGGSYGGYLTAIALAKNSDLFAAGVDWHGVHDWLTEGGDYEIAAYFRRRQLRYEKGDLKEAMDVAWKSSPDSMIDTWRSPVLLIAGDDDRNVDFHQTADLARRLEKAKVVHEVIVIPDEIHGFLRFAAWLRAESATAEFFDRMFGSPPR